MDKTPLQVAPIVQAVFLMQNHSLFLIMSTLHTDFCEGNSCHKRMLFLNVSSMVLEMFSKSFFKTYFFRPLLSLHSK